VSGKQQRNKLLTTRIERLKGPHVVTVVASPRSFNQSLGSLLCTKRQVPNFYLPADSQISLFPRTLRLRNQNTAASQSPSTLAENKAAQPARPGGSGRSRALSPEMMMESALSELCTTGKLPAFERQNREPITGHDFGHSNPTISSNRFGLYSASPVLTRKIARRLPLVFFCEISRNSSSHPKRTEAQPCAKTFQYIRVS